MPLTKAQKVQIITDALRDHLSWNGKGEDTRTLAILRKEFEQRHLGGVVKSYRRTQAEKELEDLDIADVAQWLNE